MGGGPDPASNRLWCRLDLTLPRQFEGEALGRFASGAVGAEVRPVDATRSMVCIVFPTIDAARSVLAEAREWLGQRAVHVTDAIRLETIPDEPWVERYQAALRPFPIGHRFQVFPAGRIEGPDPDRIPLILVPGRAFGTGEHPTTRLCVELLERELRAGTRWLDLGTGNAVLSLVASHLGAAEVLALDHDPEAVEVAREVIEANGAPAGVRVAEGSIDEAGPATYDGIVANIQTPFFLMHAVALAALLAAGGRLIVSGVLIDDQPDLDLAFAAAGLETLQGRRDGPWAGLVLARAGGGKR